mmetsp:Transcript_15259/g.23749  ORF Transcript_15259/g.23749 Transcript_15259/m.23749 type:complete len:378 (-) Transcript_15259:183-1316(-)|eukprot:CAMPEP_0195299632 /NCGR_PEP_ID=MMETSP0707-20130614/25895_1 /TAXON_ID=33640 /ORGANISM="Asterionellopsis glacialis, Strain CCMP134" /LENGTH=377 /DNA_ID=CAMNT_0040362083 /DNA_START=37 /DNA_END=1170 /DNA_ORIENTATION=+
MSYRTPSELTLLAVIVKPFAVLSMIGSVLIIRDILIDPPKRALTYHRILFGLSSIDVCTAFWFFLSTWAIPEGTDDIPLAAGTAGSCRAQGWFISLNIASPLYNVSLCIYYLLMIKYKWTQDQIKFKASPWLLGAPLVFGLSVAFAGLSMNLYAPATMWCWVAAHPAGCSGSECDGHSGQANDFRFAFFYGPLWTAILSMGAIMTIVYAAIKKGEGTDAFGSETSTDFFWLISKERRGEEVSQNDRSRRLARQAFWYCAAFLLTWIWPTLVRVWEISGSPPFVFYVMMALFAPLQGLMNFISYIRPRYLRNKDLHPNWNLYEVLTTVDPDEDFKLGAMRMREEMPMTNNDNGEDEVDTTNVNFNIDDEDMKKDIEIT